MLFNPIANPLCRDSIALAKLSKCPLPCRIELNGFFNLGFRHFHLRIFVSAQDGFRMQAHTIPVTSCCVFWLGKTTMPYASSHSFWACQIPLPSFASGILHVVDLGTKPEVCRIDTGRGITGVQDIHSLRNPCSRVQKPTDNMRTHIAVFVGGRAEIPVAALPMQGRSPQPTLFSCRSGNFAPKTGSKGFMGLRCPCQVITRCRTVFPDVRLMRQHGKGFGAWGIGTNQVNRGCHQRTSTAVKGMYGQARSAVAPQLAGLRNPPNQSQEYSRYALDFTGESL
jgi:hypothetical protein